MSDSFYEETIFQVWSKDGDRIEVGTDGDGLGMMELRSYADDGDVGTRFTIPNGAEQMVIRAMQRWLEEKVKKEGRP